jgi:hypothetical protein
MLQTLLQKRSNGYYYFRWVCPPAIRKILGKREIIKSLRTTSKIQALARAGAYYMAVDKLKGAAADNSVLDQVAKDELYETYKREAPRLFSLVLGSARLAKPRSFADAKTIGLELLKSLEIYRIAQANMSGEYAEGKSIYTLTKKLLDKSANYQLPDLSMFLECTGTFVIALHACCGELLLRFDA